MDKSEEKHEPQWMVVQTTDNAYIHEKKKEDWHENGYSNGDSHNGDQSHYDISKDELYEEYSPKDHWQERMQNPYGEY